MKTTTEVTTTREVTTTNKAEALESRIDNDKSNSNVQRASPIHLVVLLGVIICFANKQYA